MAASKKLSGILKDLVALVVLEEQGVPEALSDGGSARREGRSYVMLVLREPPMKKITYIRVDFYLNTRRMLGLHAQTLGTYFSALGRAIPLDQEVSTQ